MSPITHFLVSWLTAEWLTPEENQVPLSTRARDVFLVSLAGVLPDLDGLGLVVDLLNERIYHQTTDYYTLAHHVWLHGLFGCLLISLALWLCSSRRLRVFWLALLAAHLHLLCDLVGSRGPGPEELWPIVYGGPFWKQPEWSWSHQWRLDSWQNLLVTVSALWLSFSRLYRQNHSPFEWLWPRLHQTLRDTLVQRFGPPSESGSASN